MAAPAAAGAAATTAGAAADPAALAAYAAYYSQVRFLSSVQKIGFFSLRAMADEH
jgi:hypothetical protein